MTLKRRFSLLSLSAALSFLLGVGQVLAGPLTLTVDQSASALGGVPLTGAILADFNGGAQSLTFSGGSNISLTSNLTGSVVIPTAVILNILGTSVTASGSFQTNVSSLSLDLTSGTVVDGSAATVPFWSSSGSGTLAGTLDLVISVLGQVSTSAVSFSGLLTPQATFTSSAGLAPIGLSITVAGITLSLPVDVPFLGSDLDVSGGGLASDVLSAVVDFIDDTVASTTFHTEGLIVANGVVAIPEPASVALLGLGLAGLGWGRRRE